MRRHLIPLNGRDSTVRDGANRGGDSLMVACLVGDGRQSDAGAFPRMNTRLKYAVRHESRESSGSSSARQPQRGNAGKAVLFRRLRVGECISLALANAEPVLDHRMPTDLREPL